jgi:hypothetical protein
VSTWSCEYLTCLVSASHTLHLQTTFGLVAYAHKSRLRRRLIVGLPSMPRQLRRLVRYCGLERAQATYAGDIYRRRTQVIYTGDVRRRYIYRRRTQAMYAGDVRRVYIQATYAQRYIQATYAGDIYRRRTQAIYTGDVRRRYIQVTYAGDIYRRYTQAIYTGNV